MKSGIKDQGIILRRVNSGEADRIITIFTQLHGKVRVKAKGVRKITSRKSGNVEQFNRIKLSAVSGKNLEIITEVEALDSFPSLKVNLTRVAVAYHVCELVDRFLPEHQPHRDVYDILAQALTGVAELPTTDLSFLVKSFETQLLSLLGFGLPRPLSQATLVAHIEQILEKPLKSRRFLLQLTS